MSHILPLLCVNCLLKTLCSYFRATSPDPYIIKLFNPAITAVDSDMSLLIGTLDQKIVIWKASTKDIHWQMEMN